MKKNCRRQIKKNLEQKKQIREKVVNYVLNGKAMIILLIAGLIKKTLYKMGQYFQYFKPYNRFEGNVKVELDLFNYAPKTDLKGATGTDASNLALKSNLAELKAAVEKINLAKLKSVPVDLSKLSNVVNNEAVKKLYTINQLQK